MGTGSDANNGYEIKIWLENQYSASAGMTESDFNVKTIQK